MAEAKDSYLITQALRPAFYSDFTCAGGQCRLTCCRGWRIEFSKKDYLKIKQANKPAALEERFEGSLKRLRGDRVRNDLYAEIRKTEDGGCPMQTEQGLCGLQLACGAEALPKVCREFPRIALKSVEYEDRSLTPACEAVLDLLWKLPDGVEFVVEPLERPYEVRPKSDKALPYLPHYGQLRSICIDILQARHMPLTQRMLLLGMRMQQLEAPSYHAPEWFATTQAMLDDPQVPRTLAAMMGDRKKFIVNALSTTLMLDVSNDDFRTLQQDLKEAVGYTVTAVEHGENGAWKQQFYFARMSSFLERYDQTKAAFDEQFGDLEYFYENLLVTVFFGQVYPAISVRSPWECYMMLCIVYCMYRFVPVAASLNGVSRERLFDVLVSIGRASLHNDRRMNALIERLHENGTDTLAHMAISIQD